MQIIVFCTNSPLTHSPPTILDVKCTLYTYTDKYFKVFPASSVFDTQKHSTSAPGGFEPLCSPL